MQRWQQSLQQLSTWWKTPLGKNLLRQEKELLTQILQDKFGQQLILLATEEFADLITISRMHNSLRMDPLNTTELRLPTNIDFIIVPHVLAYCVAADSWLKAFWQSLIADGKVLITGFNFTSCLGIQRLLFSKNVRELPAQLYSARQLKKLLFDNDFKLIMQQRFAKSCRFEKQSRVKKNAQFGSLYTLLLNKQLVTVKTIQPQWQSAAKIGQQSLVNPFISEKR